MRESDHVIVAAGGAGVMKVLLAGQAAGAFELTGGALERVRDPFANGQPGGIRGAVPVIELVLGRAHDEGIQPQLCRHLGGRVNLAGGGIAIAFARVHPGIHESLHVRLAAGGDTR